MVFPYFLVDSDLISKISKFLQRNSMMFGVRLFQRKHFSTSNMGAAETNPRPTDCFPTFGPNMGELYLNNTFNGFIFFSASFWYNKILISLFQTSKPDIFMISGFSKPWSPVFIAFIIPKYFNKCQKVCGNIFKKIYFGISGF